MAAAVPPPRRYRALDLSQIPDGEFTAATPASAWLKRAVRSPEGGGAFPKGSMVYQQGDAADHFYIVNNGDLEMSVTTQDGTSVRVKRLKGGDHFGYDALLSERNDTTVTALTPVEVTAVPRHELRLATADDTYFKSTVQQVASLPLPRLLHPRHALLCPFQRTACAALPPSACLLRCVQVADDQHLRGAVDVLAHLE